MPDSELQLGTVLVTDAERGSATAIIRSLSRKGWRVVAGASDLLSPGMRSRHAHERLLYPSPSTDATGFVKTLRDAIPALGIDLIIPVTEEVILLLAGERQQFGQLCQIAMPDAQALQATRDKSQTIKLARRLGVPIPRTFEVETVEQAVSYASEIHWPLVLKPVLSRKINDEQHNIDKFSVSYAENMQVLRSKMKDYEGQCAVLLQEYFSGEGQGVELLAREGQVLAAFQHRRLCEIPVQGGASALRESMPLDPELFEYARCLTEAMNWTGLLMVEFKVSEYGAKLMEINGRVWGSLPLAVASGMDFPGRLADLYQGKEPDLSKAPNTDYRIGVQAADVEMLLMWILQVLWGKPTYDFLPYPARRELLPVLRKILTLRIRYDILSRHDPQPGLFLFLKIGRKLFRKVRMVRY